MFRVEPFSEGIGVQESKQEVTNVASLVQMSEIQPIVFRLFNMSFSMSGIALTYRIDAKIKQQSVLF